MDWHESVKHSIAAQITSRRLDAGLSPADVAQRLYGCRHFHALVGRTESGRVMPSLALLTNYANVLGCDVRDLTWPLDAFGQPPRWGKA